MISVDAGPARHARVLLAPGRLIDSVTQAMATLEWPSATLLILGGLMHRAVYTCSVLTPGGPRWIDYGPQRDLGPCWLAMGNATYGTAIHGGPALHCHAILTTPECTPQGGHLVPDLCEIGPQGLIAQATSAAGAGFRIIADSSGFNLLSPGAIAQ